MKEYVPTREGAAEVTVRSYGKMTLERAFNARLDEMKRIDLNQFVVKIVDMRTGKEF
jgi:hypothetical protein